MVCPALDPDLDGRRAGLAEGGAGEFGTGGGDVNVDRALVFPLVNGMLGVLVGTAIGLDIGSTAVFGVLCASASYIAVPAAMRMTVPQANPSLYISTALGLTFPFNLALGIPAYASFAAWLGG